MLWYVERDGKDTGPFTSQQLKEMVNRGDITPDTRVRQSVSRPWSPAKQVQGLFDPQRPPTIQKPEPAAMPAKAIETIESREGATRDLRTYLALATIQGIIRGLGFLVIALAVLFLLASILMTALSSSGEYTTGIDASDVGFIVGYTISMFLSGMLVLAGAEMIGLARNVAMDIQRMSQK